MKSIVKRLATLALLSGVLSGCIAGDNKNLSRLPPFNHYVGRPLFLERPVYVYYDKNHFAMPGHWISESPMRFATMENGKFQFQSHADLGIDRLPVGHQVLLDSVRLKVGFDSGCSQTALGRTRLPGTGAEVRFHYFWGYNDTLSRAPWEPDNTPALRKLAAPYLP